MEEKLCLKWNDFQHNVTSCFQDLKGDTDFADVTLACEDRTFEAHKVILSACSPFMRSLLKKTNKHPHPLFYLRGVEARVLEAMLEFIYQGEANIVHEDLDKFLNTAEEFQLKGLTRNNEEPENPTNKVFSEMQHLTSSFSVKHEFAAEYNPPGGERKQLVKYPTIAKYGTSLVPTQSKTKNLIHIDDETARKVAAMIQKQDTFWTCTVCGFKSLKNCHLKEHVENHIEGLEYPCNYCGKIMRSSNSFRKHIKCHD